MIESKAFSIIKYIMIGTTIILLAFSQIHTAALSLLFVREIGFYLFLFVFSSLIMMATLFSFREWNRSNVLQTSLATLATVATGGYTILLFIQDRADPRSVPFEEVALSFYVIVISVAVFLIGMIPLLITAKKGHVGERYGKKAIQ